MKHNILYIFIFALFFFSFQQIELSKSAQKKYDKILLDLWKTEVTLENVDIKKTAQKLGLKGYERIQTISDVNEIELGYAVISKARGRYDDFDLVVIFDTDLKIKGAEILAYREDWGGEITSVRWLKQFVGMTPDNRMELTHDIQGISGATISCQSATVEFKRLTGIVDQLKKEGVI